MTGFSKEELVGQAPFPYWPQEEYDGIYQAFRQTMQGQFRSFELVFQKKNGERFR